ncbi:MAG: 4-alpha-glucanotransferase [Candidatus Gastranaerophilales bacterium]|nr:4-alpha-glucanotransferase [Candidatus Gastranaerophilales bacterium]
MGCKLLEKDTVTETIQEALKVLGKKHFALIIHANSFPSMDDEDTGFGTINSSAGKKVIDFASGIFNVIQLGPSGKTKCCDSSPYTSTIFSNNPLFIDLKQLTTDKWYNILSQKTFNEIVKNNPNKNMGKTAYSYICNAQQSALKEAYENFKKTETKDLKDAFDKYKKENKFWLEKDALYEALSVIHNNDYWPLWKSETDKNLFNSKSIEEKMEFGNRINEIEKNYADEIDFYSFCQFVTHHQTEKTKEYALSKGIKMIADRQVAFSDRDCWAYQSLFLEDWFLGCPPDYFSNDGQAWGFPVMDPEKLFNGDGSLGEGGQLMKALFKKMFKENPGGVRIDHIVGLIDPWIYKAGKKPKVEEGAGRLYSSPEHPELAKFAIPKEEDLNSQLGADKEKRVKTLNKEQIKLYGKLIEQIVIAAAKEEGLDKDAIVCEDLGTLTNPVEAVMKKYDLQGMKLTQFVDPEMSEHPYRCKNIEKRCWVMVGTHDNEPISMWADSFINTHEGYLHAKNLAEDLFGYEENRDDIIVKLTQDADFLAQAKLIELFACEAENIQIFFTDYFGIKDVYNRPGTSGDENWSLRLPNNFEEIFCNNLKSHKALNLPVILEYAIKARGKSFAQKHGKLIERLRLI